MADADPLLRLQVLVVGEEVLDLLADDLRQVAVRLDLRIIGNTDSTGTVSSFSSPPCSSSRNSTAIGRALTTLPGMNGERAITSASSGSPSGDSVCGMKP